MYAFFVLFKFCNARSTYQLYIIITKEGIYVGIVVVGSTGF